MATKKKGNKSQWMEDGDDAHFSDNPALPKRTRRKREPEEKAKIGSSGKGHPAVKVTKKEVPSKSGSFDKIYRRPKSGTKKSYKKRVMGK